MAEKKSPKKELEPIESMDALRQRLYILEGEIEDLRIQYEQFFVGIIKRSPERQHQQLQKELRDLQSAPFKASALNYKARTLQTRFISLSTYWKRTLRDRESGIYTKDIFKADLKEVQRKEELRKNTAAGKAEHGMRELFKSYREALENSLGHSTKLNYENFQKTITQRAQEIRRISGGKALNFKVVVQDGSVTIQIEKRA